MASMGLFGKTPDTRIPSLHFNCVFKVPLEKNHRK